MGEVLYGAGTAERISAETAELVRVCAASGTIPTLSVLRYGDSAPDAAYADSLARRFQKYGLRLHCESLSGEPQTDEALLARLNADETVHGVLPMQPLPPATATLVSERLAPGKDVDGVTLASMGLLYAGKRGGFAPCTAAACMELLHDHGVDPAGKHVTIVGRSLVAGKPLAMLMLQSDATVTVCHSKSEDLPAVMRSADIVITAVGKAEHFGAECFRPGQIVLDVGTNFSEGRQCGDVLFDAVLPIVTAISPVPKGVGAVTTALLMRNVALAASRKINKKGNT